MTDLNSLENDVKFNFAKLKDVEDALYTDCTYLNLDDNCDYPETGSSFTVAHFNIHSIPNKYDDFLGLLDKLKGKCILPNVILLCETFLNVNNFDRFNFHNYDLLSEYRKNKSKGGVSIMVKSDLKYYVRNDLVIFH